ncbi:hypothetical protein F5B21DRAFT_519645 [Xylaria acuta]|nr:hypothetical protein F5B21DRAFT_519645 [Xylaria acuta]
MPSLMYLPNEVLKVVVDLLLGASSPSTVRSVASVNGLLRQIVRYRQHRVLRLPPDFGSEFLHDNKADQYDAYFRSLEDHGLLAAFRSVELGSLGRVHVPRYVWDALCEHVTKMTGLRDIHVPVPLVPLVPVACVSPLADLLDILRSHMPLVKVHARLPTMPGFGFPLLQLFENFSNLRSLTFTTYKPPDYRFAPEILPIMRALLITCPNLRVLRLYTRTLQTRREMKCESYQPLYANGEDRPRCLEILDLQDRDNWQTDPEPEPSTIWQWDINAVAEKYDDSWFGDFFDWSKLSHLRIKEVTLLPYIPNEKLTALKSFEAPNIPDYKHHDVRKFFLHIPSQLERIKLPCWNFIPLKSLFDYAHTLRALHFTHSSTVYRGYGLTPYKIQLIRTLCPLLEEFGLSVHRRDEWPRDIIDLLASLPKLRYLTIITWFSETLKSGSGFVFGTDLTRPFITYDGVHDLYQLLAAAKPPHKNRLSRLEYRRLVFEATPAERDDEAARGVVDVTCRQIGEAGNQAYRVARETGSHPSDVLGDPLPVDFHLAYYGPVVNKHFRRHRHGRSTENGDWDSGDDAEEGVYTFKSVKSQIVAAWGEVDNWGEDIVA